MQSTALYYTAVRWLSRGSTLKRVFILRNGVKDFLHNRKNENATFFKMICSLLAFALLTDVFEKLNELNILLQGRGKWVFELQTSIRAFVNKYIKSKYRNRLTDAHLQDNLIIATTTFEPRIRKLALRAIHAPFLPDRLGCRLGLSFRYASSKLFRYFCVSFSRLV